MASIISVNVYGIGSEKVPVAKYGFPVAKSAFHSPGEETSFGGVRVYGFIRTDAFGQGERDYAVVETVDALVTKANA